MKNQTTNRIPCELCGHITEYVSPKDDKYIQYCDEINLTLCSSCIDFGKSKETKTIVRKPVAILSTTILPLDGSYQIKTLTEIPDITGILHYIGHPTTKEIVENLGAVKAPTNLFEGLKESGEYAICFSIKQGMSSRKEEGFSNPHQEVDITMLDVRMIARIDWELF